MTTNGVKKKSVARKTVATILSMFMISTVVMNAPVRAQTPDPGDLSYGYSGQLDLRLLEDYLTVSGGAFDVADLTGSEQSWREGMAAPQAGEEHQIDIEALELINLNLGQLPIPLVGENALLEFALGESQVGAVAEHANARTATQALAGVGLVADQGGLELTQPGAGMDAKINLLSALQLNDTGLLSNVIDEAAVELGALSAYAEKPDGYLGQTCDTNLHAVPVDYASLEAGALPGYEVLDPALAVSRDDDSKFCSSYQIADAKVKIHAPVLDNLVTGLEPIFDGLDTTVNRLVANGGVVDGVLGLLRPVLRTLDSDLVIDVEVPVEELYNNLLDTPLSDDKGLVSISLRTGEIVVDLEKIDGRNQATGLNGLPANTPLLSVDNIAEILDTVTSLLTAPASGPNGNPHGLIATLDGVLKGTDIDGVVTGGLYDSTVTLTLALAQGTLLGGLTGSIELTSTLGALLNPGAQEVSSKTAWEADKDNTYFVQRTGLVVRILGVLVVPVVVGILKGVGGTLDALLFSESGLLSVLTAPIGGVVGGVLGLLDPVLRVVLAPIANVIVNRQSVEQTPEGNLFRVSALEVNVLKVLPGEAVLKLPVAAAAVMAQSFDPAHLELSKIALPGPGLEGVTPAADTFELNYECVYPVDVAGHPGTLDDFTRAYDHDMDVLAPLSGARTIAAGETVLVKGLPAGADCEISEVEPVSSDPLYKWSHAGWVTDRSLDGGVVEHESETHIVTLVPERNGDAAYVAAVNNYESALVDIKLNVATIGAGRRLVDGANFVYDLRCNTDMGPGTEPATALVTVDNSLVGEGYTYGSNTDTVTPTQGATVDAGLQVVPGSECSVHAVGDSVDPQVGLAPTGDTLKSRAPYTYFLDAAGAENTVRVSGEVDPQTGNTIMSEEGVSVAGINSSVTVSIPEAGVADSWKTQKLLFTVPVDNSSSDYTVNAVHAYDIDTREVVVKKQVPDIDRRAETFDFDYHYNGGIIVNQSLQHDGFFTANVPVLDQNLEPTLFHIAEDLGTDVAGPVVGWTLEGVDLGAEDTVTGGATHGEATVTLAPVENVEVLETPQWSLIVTNDYADAAFTKHIDGAQLNAGADTTMLDSGATEMTINYTVTDTTIDGDIAVEITDTSLLDYGFTLPQGVNLSPEGVLSGCEFLVDETTGARSCSITVGLPIDTDENADFYYPAEDSVATGVVTITTADGREVVAEVSDRHGAMRLTGVAGMLPDTGTMTLVWTLVLGALSAVGAAIYFVHSRRE